VTHFEHNTPVVLSLSNLDPSGSAGIQADIETLASLGCHCAPIITSLWARDTAELKEIVPIEASLLIEQTRVILEDMPVKLIKIGHLGSVEIAEAIHSILRDYPDIPVVLDSVSIYAGDDKQGLAALNQVFESLLLPLATIATPDLIEAQNIGRQADTIDACAMEILEFGCKNLLITGTLRNQTSVENRLYDQDGHCKTYQWERLGLMGHGCGATLSASIAAYLAHDLRLLDAVEQGQNFTWNTLAHSRQLGMGGRTPNRFYWTDKNSATNTRKLQ
jgi:hydroxymethylpyrimidine/phosphomethylpyrimidine kinase